MHYYISKHPSLPRRHELEGTSSRTMAVSLNNLGLTSRKITARLVILGVVRFNHVEFAVDRIRIRIMPIGEERIGRPKLP